MRETELLEDTILVEKAKAGDDEAFNELVRRHRSKAFGVARSYARDRHLAEDIVQDALMRAFLHVSSLEDAERFVPWLQRIVRNQANTMLRRGGPFGKERPLAEYIDNPGTTGNEPLEEIMQQELIASIRQMADVLKPHERRISEAHFYRQMSPSEIAELLGISPDQVYKTISRSRAKLKDARFRMRLQEYMHGRKEAGQPESVLLSLGNEKERCSGSSFAFSVFRIMRHSFGMDVSIPEVMGLTGQAFRLNVEAGRIDASGPTTYFWEPVFEAGLHSLGFASSHTGDGGLPPSPYALSLALTHIQKSAASGRPVIAWDVFAPEFDLITGYDDNEMNVIADNGKKRKTIPYEQLGRGGSGGLFVCSIDRVEPVPFEEALRRALRHIRHHSLGELGFIGYTSGLAAYQMWIRAFDNGAVDELGNAYTASVAADARKHAVQFLQIVQRKLSGMNARFARHAEEYYRDAADFLRRISELFPFPGGGAAHDPVLRKQAVWLLKEAYEAEAKGLDWLEKLSQQLENQRD
ncbi:RNA polymerase sigma factor [Paenibacillus alkalitolerans]|uniref:RNA polymerase sigma factor n=1 Tax=Paenibacillus alkalitolerans TaxID=2799335 RepID=UPI0018F65564|nr:sigma-70 family RNA polymerase sigma factor [Paenibacillus alkalitolerans]